MAIEPAAISARPAVTMTAVVATAPESPAARANGTVRPSDIPMTMSRTVLPAVKCFSTWGVCGMSAPVGGSILLDLTGGVAGGSGERRVGEEGRSRGAPYHLKKKNSEHELQVPQERQMHRVISARDHR